VLSFDGEAAVVYAEIGASRRSAGRPISQFDATIAAITRSCRASLATRNAKDFEGCGIEVVNPWTEQRGLRPGWWAIRARVPKRPASVTIIDLIGSPGFLGKRASNCNGTATGNCAVAVGFGSQAVDRGNQRRTASDNKGRTEDRRSEAVDGLRHSATSRRDQYGARSAGNNP